MSRTAAALLVLLLLSIPAVPLLAQDEAKRSEILEDEGLSAESRGLYEEALDKFKRAMAEAIEEASRAPTPDARAEDLARAEFHLEKVARLTEETSRFEETEEFLRGVDRAKAGPTLKAWAEWYRARALVAEGRLEEVRKLMGDLGFLTDFQVAGSFENERGGGFARAYPPERGPVDLDARMKGKEREIGWRRVSLFPLFGFVDLDAIFRPNDQCLAYAMTWVRSPEARNAVVRVASDEAVKAWVNGTLVLARDVQRTCGFDQDLARASLRKGWNRLLIKVGDQKGAWGFRVRLTHTDGTAMTDLEVSASRETAAAAEEALAGVDAGETAEFSFATGGREALERVEKAGRATARTLLHLGWLHHRRRYEDRNLRKAREILARAAELDPENPNVRFALALAATKTSGDKVDREENERRQHLEVTIGLDRGYAEAHYLLAHYYTYSLPLYDKADVNLAKALEINPRFLDARLLEIDLLRRRNLRVEATAKLRVLLAEEEAFATYTPFLLHSAGFARSKGKRSAAEATYRKALGADFLSGAARDRLIGLLKRAGGIEEALALYDERIRLSPYDVSARTRKALMLEGLGRFEEAAQTALEALRLCPEDDGILNQIGRVHMKIGDEKKALAFMKEALELNPKFARLRRYVEFVDPESRPFEDAFPVDLAPLLAKAKDYTSEENDPWLTVLDQQVDKVNTDGTSASFRRLVVKILNEQGARRYDRFRPWYSGGEQTIHFKIARVISPDGSTEDGRIARGTADLPPLTPGDIVHLEWRVTDLAQSFFGDYFGRTFYLGGWFPVLKSQYVVIAPEDKALYFHTRNVDVEPTVSVGPEGRTKIFTFTRTDVGKIRIEPNMPAQQEVFPQVQVSNYRSWDDFARWYWHLIRNQLQINDEMREKVKELTEGKETRYEKIRAIYDFVITDIRYDDSWEFGVHGYKPYDAPSIYARKSGDCKDKSILITTLLKEIGIESYPVLINGTGQRWEEDLALPLVGHFNHCISYVPDVDGEGRPMFLDGTAQYHSIEAMPGMDRGARVLIVTPDGGRVTEVPWNTADLNGIEQTFDATVAADGSGKVKATLTFGGDLSVVIRSAFSIEGQRELRMKMLVGSLFGKAEMTDFSFSDLEDLSVTTASLSVAADVAKLATETPRGMSLKVSFSPFGLSALAARTEREWDLVLSNPNGMVVKGSYTLPAGYKAVSVPEDVRVEDTFGVFSATYEVENGRVSYTHVLRLTTHRVAKKDYPRFREFLIAADVALKERIVIAKD